MEQGIVPNNVLPDRWFFSSAVPGLHGLEVFLREIELTLLRLSFLQDLLHSRCRCGHTEVRQIPPGWQRNPVKFSAMQMQASGMHWSLL